MIDYNKGGNTQMKLYRKNGTLFEQVKFSLDSILADTFPPSSHNHDDRYYTESEVDAKTFLKANTDNRSVATVPYDYVSKFDIKGLKFNTTLGISNEGTFSYLMGLKGWSDQTGGPTHELAFGNNGGVYHRIGDIVGSTEDTWKSWRKLAYKDEVDLKASLSQVWQTDIVRTKNTILAAPDGANGTAFFRPLAVADLPDIPNSKLSGLEGRLDLLSGSIFNYFLDAQNKIYENLIPAVAITDTFEANSQVAMLALSAQKGDICIRTDLNKSYVLAQSPASTLANWKELRTPTDAVLSVAGKTGAVSLNKNDVGLFNVDDTSDVNKPVSNATQNALNLKANLASPTFTGSPSRDTDINVETHIPNKTLATTKYVLDFNGGKREYHVTASEYASLGASRDPNGIYYIRGTI